MTGISRGARLWALLDQNPHPVIVLDRAPDGWWVAVEEMTDDRGHPVTVQRSARHLYPSRGAATDAGKAKR